MSDGSQTQVPVLAYYRYLGRDDQRGGSTRHFCGACRRGIGGVYGSACYGWSEYPEQLEAENETAHGLGSFGLDKGPLEYYAFCPWCGAEFEDEWWKDRTIQNERVIDHYKNPGTHKGDSHEFRGEGPNCMANHWLGVSGGNRVCWCDPEIEPGLMGCVIRHQDKRYEDVIAAEEAARAADDEDDDDPVLTADEFERQYAERSGLTVDKLRALGRDVRRCKCGSDSCEGWQSISQVRIDEEEADWRAGHCSVPDWIDGGDA